MNLALCPISIREASAFVAVHHSHHRPPQGAKFAVGIKQDGRLCAVAIVGRPVARMLDDGATAEVTRLCTDGTPHAASKALTHAKRAAQAMGFRRVVTYTLVSETGISLSAAGWRAVEESGGGSWCRPSRGREDKHPTNGKVRWESNEPAPKGAERRT